MFNFPYDSSRVTVELGDLIDSGINLWDFEYKNWYTGEAKRDLEQKLIDRYRFRQIGFETPARFMHYFRTRVKEIAPYYFELHKSVELFNSIEDPLQAYDLTETYTEETTGTRSETGENTGTSNSTTSGSSETETSEDRTSTTNRTVNADGTKRFSNTPQGSLANLDSYMTEATINEDTNTETGTDTSEGSGSSSTTNTGTATATSSGTSETSGEEAGTKKYTLTRKGNIGVTVLGEEMIKHRKAIINLDEDFINEFKDLFLGVY